MAMDPVTGSLISAGIQGIFGISSANKQWQRQKEMMKNAHQWEVQDLRKAGLNPILSATGGNGAGSFTAPSADTPDLDLASAAQAKESLKLQNESIKNQNEVFKSQIKVNKELETKTFYEGLKSWSEKLNADKAWEYSDKLYKADLELKEAQKFATILRGVSGAQADYATANLHSATAHNVSLDSNKKQTESDMWGNSTFSKYLPYAKEIIGLIKDASSAFSIAGAGK